MNDNEFLLYDRIQAIESANLKYDFNKNAYISFSGGKDSCILSHLIDVAIPNNSIPRVFFNTGIEYKVIVDFVKGLCNVDDRFIIVNTGKNVKETLERVGYPFKSKQHSQNVGIYQSKGETSKTYLKYLGIEGDKKKQFQCREDLKYQFTKDFNIKISNKCCKEFKKDIAKLYEKENNKTLVIMGMRQEEKGSRNNLTCFSEDKGRKVVKYNPLSVINNAFCDWFIKEQKIELCKLYHPPFNFKRTGCAGCPFNIELQKDLNLLKEYLPNEYKKCEYIWGVVYDEYRRIGYRLKKEDNSIVDLFDF